MPLASLARRTNPSTRRAILRYKLHATASRGSSLRQEQSIMEQLKVGGRILLDRTSRTICLDPDISVTVLS